MNLAQGDEIPQIITRITRQRPAEFLTTCAKRLLQQYPPESGHRLLKGPRPMGQKQDKFAHSPSQRRGRLRSEPTISAAAA